MAPFFASRNITHFILLLLRHSNNKVISLSRTRGQVPSESLTSPLILDSHIIFA